MRPVVRTSGHTVGGTGLLGRKSWITQLILLNLHQLLGRRAIDTKEVLDDEVVEL